MQLEPATFKSIYPQVVFKSRVGSYQKYLIYRLGIGNEVGFG